MANRFTDSRKWDDDWFLELMPDHKLLWLYILDKCNHAGIYKHSTRLEQCCLGCSADWKEALNAFGNKVQHLRDNKYFVPNFVFFQYGTLNPDNRCHKSVIDILEKEGAYKGLKCSLQGCKDKDKSKDKVKDKDKKVKKLSDEEWLLEQKKKPEFSHINFDKEIIGMDEWLSKHSSRQLTRGFMLNWLKKVDKTVDIKREKRYYSR